jgi:sugar lactone lactonase YvrE
VVDASGNTYLNGSDYRFGLPNGMIVTPDNKTLIVTESFKARLTAFDIAADGSLSNRRVWADLGQGGDGMCLDAEGAVWTPAFKEGKPGCARVREGGEVLQWVELDQFCFACMLGGGDGKTLFMLVAEWRGVEHMDTLFRSHTGKVLTTRAPAPHAGRP